MLRITFTLFCFVACLISQAASADDSKKIMIDYRELERLTSPNFKLYDNNYAIYFTGPNQAVYKSTRDLEAKPAWWSIEMATANLKKPQPWKRNKPTQVELKGEPVLCIEINKRKGENPSSAICQKIYKSRQQDKLYYYLYTRCNLKERVENNLVFCDWTDEDTTYAYIHENNADGVSTDHLSRQTVLQLNDKFSDFSDSQCTDKKVMSVCLDLMIEKNPEPLKRGERKNASYKNIDNYINIVTQTNQIKQEQFVEAVFERFFDSDTDNLQVLSNENSILEKKCLSESNNNFDRNEHRNACIKAITYQRLKGANLKISNGIEGLPSQTIAMIWGLDFKNAHYFKYRVANRRNGEFIFLRDDNHIRLDDNEASESLRKAAFLPDVENGTEQSRQIVRSYFDTFVNTPSELDIFFNKIIPNCSKCDANEYISRLTLDNYTTASIETESIFGALIRNKQLNSDSTHRYLANVLNSSREIKYFVQTVLPACRECDEKELLTAMTAKPFFGAALGEGFFHSEEYNRVLSRLSAETTVSAFLEHGLNTPDKLPKFLSLLESCSTCDFTIYAERAISKMPKDFFQLNISNFGNSEIYRRMISKIPYQLTAEDDANGFVLKLTAANRVFTQNIKGDCQFSRKATEVRDAGFFDTLFTGADARRKFYNVYSCKLSGHDWSNVEKFANSIKLSNTIAKLKSISNWNYYKFTGDEKIVYERAPSTYIPPPTDGSSESNSRHSSSNSSSKSSTEQKRGVRSIQNNGMIGGNPSSAIECLSGGRHIVYRKNDTWYTGGGGHMGNKYNSWSLAAIYT